MATESQTLLTLRNCVDSVANTVVLRDSNGDFTANMITAGLIGNASSATKLATARNINGQSFDGTADVTLSTDDVGEGTSNLYFTNARVRSAISATGAISFNSSTGEFTFTGVSSVAGKTGNVTLGAADVGLGSVLNSAQVVNAGGVPSIQAGTFAARPAASTSGRLYLATDTAELYRDTGSIWALARPAMTGDVTSSAGSNVSTWWQSARPVHTSRSRLTRRVASLLVLTPRH